MNDRKEFFERCDDVSSVAYWYQKNRTRPSRRFQSLQSAGRDEAKWGACLENDKHKIDPRRA